MAAKPAEVCTSCGTPMDDSSAEFGCTVCLLGLGLNEGAGYNNDPATTLEAPEQLGAYIIARREDGSPWELGRGAMGVTYRAIDSTLDRPVALKIVQDGHRATNAETRERFVREARAAAALRHPNVATVYQFGIHEETGQCFYAMELVEGETLDDRVRRAGPLDVGTTLEVAAQVADALAAAEKRGLVHRDLKPGNIMVVGDGKDGQLQVKVIDFGVAKALNQGTDAMALTHGGFVGTPAFASPEQFARDPIDVRSDIYSLGVTLWFLLTGQMPFRGQTVEELREARRASALPIEQLKAARVPSRIIALIVSMLSLEPAARPAVTALATKLQRSRQPRMARAAVGGALLMVVAASVFLTPRLFKSGASSDAAQKSIAVLPLEDLSNDAHSFLASGIHEDILVSLSKIADLKVISRNSVMPYRGTGRDLREIGRALDVNAVLEGSVRNEGGRTRINVQLIRAADGLQIFAENYEHDSSDVFAFGSEVALRIASALRANLSALETARLQQPPTKNREAYLRFVEARNFYADYRRLEPDLEKAERAYQEAIALDPNFALAHARLSQVENMIHEMYDHTPERREKARAAAREALRLQADLPEAHLALALDYWRANLGTAEIDFERALAEFVLAQRGLPNDAEISGLLGQVERHRGRWRESTAYFKRAASLDPNSVERWHRLFGNYLLTRNYAAADEALTHTIALAPSASRWRYGLQRAFLHLSWRGDVSEIAQLPAPPAGDPAGPHTEEIVAAKIYLRRYDEAEKAVLNDEREIFSWGLLDGAPKSLVLGRIHVYTRDDEKARRAFEAARVVLEQSVKEKPRDANQRMFLAEAYARLGRKEEAIREARAGAAMVPESKDAYYGIDQQNKLARIYVMTGEFELALPIMEHSLSTPAGFVVNDLRLNPFWDAIRGDPRFQELMARPDVVISVNPD